MPFFTKEIVDFNKYMRKMTMKILRSKKWARMIREVDIGVKKPQDIRGFRVQLKPKGGSPFAELSWSHDGRWEEPTIEFDWSMFPYMGRQFIRVCLIHELIHLYLLGNNVHSMGTAFVRCEKFWGIEKIEVEQRFKWRVEKGKWRAD